MKYYLIAVTGGTEAQTVGPLTEKEIEITGRKVCDEQRPDYDSLFVVALNGDFTVAESYPFSAGEAQRWCDLCGLALDEGQGDEGLCRKCADRLETDLEGQNS